MGGNAFGSSISMPRMPPDIYNEVRLQVLTLLRQHYLHAETAIEAPKLDHGDIDAIVAGPISSNQDATAPQHLAAVLGATQWTRNGPTTHFALPWPESHKKDAKLARFIQLDVRSCPDVASFKWSLFYQAHGDLWSMIGCVIRRYGLTYTDKGLFIRIAELEPHNRNLARVKLTDNPSMVLAYLGLDENIYWKRFESSETMMDYVATCRFHDPTRVLSTENTNSNGGHTGKQTDKTQPTAPASSIVNEHDDEEKNRLFLNANDRQRALKRPIFRAWLDNYLPTHQRNPFPAGSAAHLTREDVIADAKAFFGPSFAASFDERRKEGLKTVAESRLWPLIRKSVPLEGEELGLVMRGLKREISGDDEKTTKKIGDDMVDGGGVGEEVPSRQKKDYAEGRFEEVIQWALENWETVGERQRQFETGMSR